MKQQNLRIRNVKVNVKGKIIEYNEHYLVDENGNEIFDRNVEIENDNRLYDIYKKQSNLLTSQEIKKIRKKYNMTQKEFAFSIGLGEVTINRFEKGSIQTDAVDAVIRLSNDPRNMYELLLKNKNNLDQIFFNNTISIVQKLIDNKKHAIANINYNDFFNTKIKEENVLDVAQNIIKIYNKNSDEFAKKYNQIPEYITNLKLQKLLYYVQGICLMIFDVPAYNEPIIAWDLGPVIEEVYQKYKNNKKYEIKTPTKINNINDNLIKIINIVVESYGTMETSKLVTFTHQENPWIKTKHNDIIDLNLIKDYFKTIYNK